MSVAEIDQTTPGEKWSFDDSVTQVFDDMLMRSIPQYDVMRKATFDIAQPYVKPNTDIVDLGCSRGESLKPFIHKYGAQNHFVGIEVSEPMLEAARNQFKGYIDCGVVDIKSLDLRTDYPYVKASVTLSILTLQFTPIEYRHQILKRIYDSTLPGGVFILVEKILGDTCSIDTLFRDCYYNLKSENGYTQDQIDRKKLSLEGVLVPVTSKWNEELLSKAGFSQVDCFWRWMNFAGWVALK